MVLKFPSPNGHFFINASDQHADIEGGQISSSAASDILLIEQARRFFTSEIQEAVQRVLESTVCLSPRIFTTAVEYKVNSRISEFILEEDPFAARLWSVLNDNGIEKFVRTQAAQYGHELRRLTTMVASSTKFVTDPADLEGEPIHAIISNLRTANNLRWRDDYFQRPELYSCLKQFVLALARYFNDTKLALISGNRRLTHGNTPTTASIILSSCPIANSLQSYFDGFMKELEGSARNTQSMFVDVVLWLREAFEPQPIGQLLLAPPPSTTLSEYFSLCQFKVTRDRQAELRLAMQLSDYISEHIPVDPDRVIWPFVTEKEYKKYKKLVEKRDAGRSVNSIPEFSDRFAPLLVEVLLEGREGWPGRQKMCYVDVRVGDQFESIYCPVLAAIILMMYYLGCRNSQAKRTDSGEGDFLKYNPSTKAWEPNTGPLAGFWTRKNGTRYEADKCRNYAVDLGSFAGFYLTTNKGPNGHVIEYNCEELHSVLFDCRNWQETYNPEASAIGPELYLDSPTSYSEETLKTFPEIIPLFRVPVQSRGNRINQPPTYTTVMNFYCKALLEVSRRYNQRNPGENVQLVSINATTGQPHKPIFPPHGLRSRKATEALRRNVPFEVVSRNILGHKSLKMTTVYDRRTAEEIDALIQKGGIERRAEEQLDFQETLKKCTPEQARKLALTVSDSAIIAATTTSNHPTFCNVEIGLCPLDGTACDRGGPNGEPIGVRNCVMCKFFITGTPWAVQLNAYSKLLVQRIGHRQADIGRYREEVNGAHSMWNEGSLSRSAWVSIRDGRMPTVKALEAEVKLLEIARRSAERYLGGCKRMIARSNKPTLIVNSMEAIDVAHASGRFHSLGWAAMFGMVYTVLQDDRTEAELLRYVQTIAHRNDLRPAFVVNALSRTEARQSLFQYTRILLKNLDGEMIEQVADGTRRLDETDEGRAVLSALRESGGKEFHLFDRPVKAHELAEETHE